MENLPFVGDQEHAYEVVRRMEAPGKLDTVVHKGDECCENAGNDVIHQCEPAQLRDFRVHAMQQTEQQAVDNDHRNPTGCRPTEQLQQVAAEQQFFEAGLQRNDEQADQQERKKGFGLEVPEQGFAVLKIADGEQNPHDQCRQEKSGQEAFQIEDFSGGEIGFNRSMVDKPESYEQHREADHERKQIDGEKQVFPQSCFVLRNCQNVHLFDAKAFRAHRNHKRDIPKADNA